ncbi:MAG TPA: PVC-type heme-binding CxxCH protein, partial [Chitinophagaceae bacterium]|nr:PVC-type heme-binding CxxCH protein [Chitinophagaceae bacterium]
VAAEPLVADPVAMEIDENGNLYVVENHGYPLDKNNASKVKLLKDTDGDGQMDKSTIFADSLVMPTGILRWKKGVLVTDAPHVFYLEDTTGDDKADVRKIMLTGFALSNPQHNVNNPILGLDNWIYLAHERSIGTQVYNDKFGDKGSDIFYPDYANSPRLPNNANGRNVRFQPDEHTLEELASSTQFGQSFDTWGNHLLVSNSNHLFHEVMATRYLKRNPGLLISRTTQSLPDHGNAAEVFPITKNPQKQLLTDVGVMTSACAITAYTGGAFPADYNNNLTFVAEPVSNIVHADRLKAQGASFVASRLRPKKEFLASTDAWFRPVNMYIGPDGALYVVDYYREIIEHPEWLSDDVINSGKLYNGHDMGRIYRISAKDAGPASWTRNLALGNASTETLIEKLAEPNIWWRRNAQRLLLDRKHPSMVEGLEKMALQNRSAVGRLHALWTLEGMAALRPALIAQALKDPEPGIRENAIKLAELHMDAAPVLVGSLYEMQGDVNAKVRFQLLCTLGFITTPEAEQVRHKLLFQDISDEWIQYAALSASSSESTALLESVINQYQPDIPAYASLVQSVTASVGAGENRDFLSRLLQKATMPVPEDKLTWQVPVLKGLAQAFQSRNAAISSDEQTVLIDAFFNHPAIRVKEAALQVLQAKRLTGGDQIQSAIMKAQGIAADIKAPVEQRVLAVGFLSLQNPALHTPFLQKLIISNESLSLRLAAAKAYSAVPGPAVPAYYLQQWPNLPTALQDAALNSFMDAPDRIPLLLDAIESGKIQQASIGWPRSVRLMTQQNIKLRDRARALLAKDNQRQKVILQYQAALKLRGNREKGKQVYQVNCAICHQVKGEMGLPFGPDLGTIQSWPASGIMNNILDPNQSIADSYDLWNIGLKNGESLQGIISQETSSSLTVRFASGMVRTIARQDISSQKAMNMSAMPAGLEKQMNHQQMADLLAYLRQSK